MPRILPGPPEERSNFWSSMSLSLGSRSNPRRFPLFVLIDANAALGSVQSAAVGGCDPGRECENGAEFHKILRQQRLFLPSTFSMFQRGESHTLQLPTGSWVRRDYVAVPAPMKDGVKKAYVDQEFLLATLREDHRASRCRGCVVLPQKLCCVEAAEVLF